MAEDFYTSGAYLGHNPTWHVEDSPWKAAQIARLLERNQLSPRTVGEVGCGAGEVLSQLQQRLGERCELWGYDVSPQAIALAERRANPKLHFTLADLGVMADHTFDVLLLIDIIEHLEDYFGFLRAMQAKALHKVLHIPLDLSVQSVLRGTLMKHRAAVGHIHYFTKETALQTLADVGYRVLDYRYTGTAVDLPARSAISYLAKLPRRLAGAMHRDLAVRILGGYSLLVLAR